MDKKSTGDKVRDKIGSVITKASRGTKSAVSGAIRRVTTHEDVRKIQDFERDDRMRRMQAATRAVDVAYQQCAKSGATYDLYEGEFAPELASALARKFKWHFSDNTVLKIANKNFMYHMLGDNMPTAVSDYYNMFQGVDIFQDVCGIVRADIAKRYKVDNFEQLSEMKGDAFDTYTAFTQYLVTKSKDIAEMNKTNQEIRGRQTQAIHSMSSVNTNTLDRDNTIQEAPTYGK